MMISCMLKRNSSICTTSIKAETGLKYDLYSENNKPEDGPKDENIFFTCKIDNKRHHH